MLLLKIIWLYAISTRVIAIPSREDIKIIGSNACQPNQAPNAANSLKSPWPRPSFPVMILNNQ